MRKRLLKYFLCLLIPLISGLQTGLTQDSLYWFNANQVRTMYETVIRYDQCIEQVTSLQAQVFLMDSSIIVKDKIIQSQQDLINYQKKIIGIAEEKSANQDKIISNLQHDYKNLKYQEYFFIGSTGVLTFFLLLSVL